MFEYLIVHSKMTINQLVADFENSAPHNEVFGNITATAIGHCAEGFIMHHPNFHITFYSTSR